MTRLRDPIGSNRTCNKCGTVAFSVTRKYAEDEVARSNAYFAKLSQEEIDDYYGGNRTCRTVKSYERCRCGNDYNNFRNSKEGDCPDGCTLNPIIERDVV